MLLSFFLFLLLFLGVGVASLLKNRHTTVDYLIATHSVSPFIVALSAVATNNSGYMFIGMIGFTYVYGLMSVWLMVGWITGDFLMSLVVYPHLRTVSAKSDVYSFSGVLSDWYGHPFRLLRKIGGIITLIFLITYAAAQLKAGSKALHVLFGFHESIGAILGCGIVVLYCMVGGIRASFWTDLAQSMVMIVAMAVLAFQGVQANGGFESSWTSLSEISPTYLSIMPQGLPLGPLFGPLLFITGWFFAGFAVVGQPHIMMRFMALDSVKHLRRTRIYYYSWYILFYLMTIAVGLLSRLLIDKGENFDPELALPLIAVELLPGPLAGMVIAGIFAATMSTADSQILACTSSATGDFRKKHITSYTLTKLFTVAIGLLSLVIALAAHRSVFTLVVFSWGALGSAFMPLVFLYSLGRRITQKLSIAMVLTGLFTAVLFRLFFGGLFVYEALPGILAGFIPYLLFPSHRHPLRSVKEGNPNN